LTFQELGLSHLYFVLLISIYIYVQDITPAPQKANHVSTINLPKYRASLVPSWLHSCYNPFTPVLHNLLRHNFKIHKITVLAVITFLYNWKNQLQLQHEYRSWTNTI